MSKRKLLRVIVSLLIIASARYFPLVNSSGEDSIVADFYDETTINRIAFGTVYADTKVAPLLWTPSPLNEMVEKFNYLKFSSEYQEFLRSGIKVLGVWDDHDYGMNNGGKHYKDRLQAQGIYLDFLDEPAESIRRRREGTYVSYSFGTGNKSIKLILLDTRSHLKWGPECDILGAEQWSWLETQLSDPNPAGLTIIGSGIQVISDVPYTDRWTGCPSSYDRLIWLVQRNPRVILISGDVHFGEFSCLNSTSTGYPLYEVTSSGLTATCVSWMSKATCRWLLENVLTSSKRTHPFITELNYGLITVHWNDQPISVTVEVRGETGSYLKQTVSLGHLERLGLEPRSAKSKGLKLDSSRGIKHFLSPTCDNQVRNILFFTIILFRLIIFILKILLTKIVLPLLGITLQAPSSSGSSLQHTKHKNNKILKAE
ncbi:hypothetical protein pdam_00009939 [Pocillopora damicornis]|uniref:PhoD-like phosphatase metallophosphatase domain-containing protein n=1 Tax=Pocillopora damicornis TaxID=46731 RepID=A0A3M6UT09_POCDA|nr:hypothetical protein pdam_00009939 [Pocillopora damicornis]